MLGLPGTFIRAALLGPVLIAPPYQRPQPLAVIPLAEHPRPDFQRQEWQNLNGTWQFQFDPGDVGGTRGWPQSGLPKARAIVVPFPWGSPLSGVPDSGDIGWYARTIEVPAAWSRGGRRVFCVVGAADWRTTAWLDGHPLGTHDGGYIPFEFELTTYIKPGRKQLLVLRIDDAPRPFKLEGKQGYGNARGIWQTPYLEARGGIPLKLLHFSPDVDRKRVVVTARLLERAPRDMTLTLRVKNVELPVVTRRVPRGTDQLTFAVPIPSVHLGHHAARDRLPLRRPQRCADLSAAHARPGVPSGGVLYVSERFVHPRRDPACQTDRSERAARARQGRVAA